MCSFSLSGVTQDHSDIGDLDESTLDTDKSSFSYRFSRTKSDVKNDDNRESSKCMKSWQIETNVLICAIEGLGGIKVKISKLVEELSNY